MKNRIIYRGLGIALFVVGIAFCIAAVLGHEPACSASACCLFAAIPILSGSNHEKKDKDGTVNYALQAADICFIIENIHRSFHKRIVIRRKDYNGKFSKKGRTKFGGITETKILFPVHLVINYFYPDNQGTYIGWVILIIGALLFVPYFLKYYKVEIKLK